MTPTTTTAPAQGAAKDAALTRGDLLERCAARSPAPARMRPWSADTERGRKISSSR